MLQEFEAPLPGEQEAAAAKVQTKGAINILFSIGACLLLGLRKLHAWLGQVAAGFGILRA